jgi:hypothetical protein
MTLEQRGESLQRAHLLRPALPLPQVQATVFESALVRAGSAHGAAERSAFSSTRPVLARRPEPARTRAAAAPPVIPVPVPLCLTRPNMIEHVPRPLRLLSLLSPPSTSWPRRSALGTSEIRIALASLPEVNSDKQASRALADLNSDTNAAVLIAKYALGDEETSHPGAARRAAAQSRPIRAASSRRPPPARRTEAPRRRHPASRLGRRTAGGAPAAPGRRQPR